ncbi:unnamed protein product [Anisakis simplex]|uniref:Uncharacterized protein n=1 Tax=Anisakis simplex TaxID=6269 RepID=A0A0M3JV66_ANISI|nr:unnamed protein product [Anisakis simplex]
MFFAGNFILGLNFSGSGGTISPTVIDTRRSQQQQQENVRAFYQPEIMSRRPLSISPQPWKTQGPISPSNRAVPASGIRYGQSLRSESYTSSTTKPQQQSTGE